MGIGLTTFSLHQYDAPQGVLPEGTAVPSDAVEAARLYLTTALGGVQGAAPEAGLELASIGTFDEPLTKTKFVKFQQRLQNVPIFGSVATVEMDSSNNLVSISTETGAPNVSAQPQVSADRAAATVATAAGFSDPSQLGVTPQLVFYNSNGEAWYLAYIFPGVPTQGAGGAPLAIVPDDDVVAVNDYFVDAASGNVIAKVPAVWTIDESAPDILGATRSFRTDASSNDPNLHVLFDALLNVGTYDFANQAVQTSLASGNNTPYLPGALVPNPPTPWSPAGVSAHANASEVLTFLREILRRNGIDGQGSLAVSSVNCVWTAGATTWPNAAWLPSRKQMVYGQTQDASGTLKSWALDLCVVGHEFFHGVTQNTANLLYQGLPGALNESLSDIFGTLIANRNQSDLTQWDWRVGSNLPGGPLRDMQNPASRTASNGQPYPINMSQYNAAMTSDHGGVHFWSNIHNLAFYNVITSRQGSASWAYFTPGWVAMAYYVTLSYRLGATSTFSDMRRGLLATARTLLQGDPLLSDKTAAIAAAYTAVGIA
jgi:Zn-dependent metalloprotease